MQDTQVALSPLSICYHSSDLKTAKGIRTLFLMAKASSGGGKYYMKERKYSNVAKVNVDSVSIKI